MNSHKDSRTRLCRSTHFLPEIIILVCVGVCLVFTQTSSRAQAYGRPDRGQPGDVMIQDYLEHEAARIEADFFGEVKSAEDWNRVRPQLLVEYYEMLGLWPLPDKTPLRASITRTLDMGDYVVDMLHYQSRPGLYVTANLYRPARLESGERLPAVLYVCGHSSRGRNGGKAAFQSHGIWFARHGYVCLMVDTLQLGEIAGIHHGTYRENRWWWLSRGYTPAGVECWNGIRGIDYLLSRPDVDPERIGVTGISGGGAATFWIAAADDRVKVAIPVSGMADLMSYVPNRVVNGHCDCMFLYNAHQWNWTRIAGLIAPRPLLFVNSDADAIFPMDANERVINRLERLYSFFGTGDIVDSVVSVGGHAYRMDIRQAAYRFMNTHLKNDPGPILDSEVDLVTGSRDELHPIAPEQLRVFPKDSDIPRDMLNARIDEEFVPVAKPRVPASGEFPRWRDSLTSNLRRLTFHHFPGQIPAAEPMEEVSQDVLQLKTEPSVAVRLRTVQSAHDAPARILLVVSESDVNARAPQWSDTLISDRDAIYTLEPRGRGASQWTAKNPPNYVERSHYLLGRTVASGRIWDIIATARYLRDRTANATPVVLIGENSSAVLAAYAAVLEQEIAGLIISRVPGSHMDAEAPALLNVLRVCDVPEAIGLIAPRPVTLVGGAPDWAGTAAAIYRSAGAAAQFRTAPY